MVSDGHATHGSSDAAENTPSDRNISDTQEPRQRPSVSWLDATFILAILTGFSYLAGRIYTEQYYDQFAVNYRSLDFSTATYMFNGWNVISTAISLGIFILTLIWVCYGWCRNRRNSESPSDISFVVISLIIIVTIFWLIIKWPFTPWDLIIQFFSILTVLSYLFSGRAHINNEQTKLLTRLRNAPSPIFLGALLVILAAVWFYFLSAATVVAWHHAERAKAGGMGTKIVQLRKHCKESISAPNERNSLPDGLWLLLTGIDDDRVLLYRDNPLSESILVPNTAIAITRNYTNTVSKYDCDLLPPP